MKVAVIYFCLVNIAGFVMMGVDKSRARRKAWRISEKSLFTCALIGGSIGAIAGMYVFRHKTKHWYFKYGFPLILIAEAALVIWVMFFLL